MNAHSDLLQPLFQDAIEMLSATWATVCRHDLAPLDSAEALGRSIHKRETELTEQLLRAPAGEAASLRFVPGHLERIGDAAESLIRCARTMEAEGTRFTSEGTQETNELFDRTIDLLECTRDLALTRNRVLSRHVELESMRLQELASEFARAHEQRLIEGVCLPRASSAYLAILDCLREVIRHCRRIAARVVEQRPTEGAP